MTEDCMADCPRVDPLVTPFIDGALSDPERQAVEHHLRLCPPCWSRVAAERAVRDLLQAHKLALCAPLAPAALRTACACLNRRATAEAARPATVTAGNTEETPGILRVSVPSWRSSPRLAGRAGFRRGLLAASLVVLAGGAFLYQATGQSSRLMAAELTADHIKCQAINAVLGTHQSLEAVEGAMASGYGWRMRLPEDPSLAGLELVASRPCLYAEGKFVHIM